MVEAGPGGRRDAARAAALTLLAGRCRGRPGGADRKLAGAQAQVPPTETRRTDYGGQWPTLERSAESGPAAATDDRVVAATSPTRLRPSQRCRVDRSDGIRVGTPTTGPKVAVSPAPARTHHHPRCPKIHRGGTGPEVRASGVLGTGRPWRLRRATAARVPYRSLAQPHTGQVTWTFARPARGHPVDPVLLRHACQLTART